MILNTTELAVNGGFHRDVTVEGGAVVRFFKSDKFIGVEDGFRLQKIFLRNAQIWWFSDKNFKDTTNEMITFEGEDVIIRHQDDYFIR